MSKGEVGTSQRLSLTKRHLETTEGAELLDLLTEILEDGELDDVEIEVLSSWLQHTDSSVRIPGIYFLQEELAGILADGVISDSERHLLQNAILRVLPVSERERAKSKIAEFSAKQKAAHIQSSNLATEKQKSFISDLGGVCPDSMTKSAASELIDSLLVTRPTVRQQMVLRFWHRLDLSRAGVEGVSAWMDQWYDEDPDRRRAWELWKEESGDIGLRTPECVEKVPIGVGDQYLARVKAMPVQAGTNRHSGCGCLGTTAVFSIMVAVCVTSILLTIFK